MAHTHSPKTFLRMVRRPLLRQYFVFRNVAITVPDNVGKRADIERLFADILSLPPVEQRRVERDISDIAHLASPRGTESLLREAAIEGLHELPRMFQLAHNHYERSLWTFLNQPKLFERTLLYFHIDQVAESRWRRRVVFRQMPAKADAKTLALLTEQIQRLYQREGRGRYCKMDYFPRQQPMRHCFFAYPEDHTSSEIAYGDDGELCRRTRRPALEVICVYRPDDGVVEVLAPGGRDRVDEVANLFAGAVLGMETPIPPVRGVAFDLSVLKDRNFDFPTNPEDGINAVYVKELHCKVVGPGDRHVVFRAKPSQGGPTATHDLLEQITKEDVQTMFSVVGARLQLVLAGDGEAKGKRVSFTVAAPDSCSLKDDPHDQLAKKYLRRWGIAKTGPGATDIPGRRFA